MFKIALSAGHYKYTAGKRCMKSLDPNETREWILNDRIADRVLSRIRIRVETEAIAQLRDMLNEIGD